MKKNYDVVVIGCGVTGASCARFLSRFNASVLVVERHNDVGDETSCANSAIDHSGYDPKPGTLKAKFNVLGNKMMPIICEELDVPFINNGSITVGFSDEEYQELVKLKARADENGVPAKLLTREELVALEPNISDIATCGLLCPTAGIINPFRLTVGYIENAMDNGVELALNTEIADIKKIGKEYKLVTKNGDEIIARAVVNATGQNSAIMHSKIEKPRYDIVFRKGEYIVLDHFDNNWVKHTLFMCPTKVGKGVLVSPTTSYNYIIGPSNDETTMNDTSTDSATFAALKEAAGKLVKNVPYFNTIREFAGVRANSSVGDFVIEESKENEGFFEVGGIMSPGLASSPAIGEYVSNLVKDRLNLTEKKNYNPYIRKHIENKDPNINEIIKEHKEFGHIICRCESVSEGQILDVIHRNAGATTVKGVKKRIRAGFGRCQGGMCQEEVTKILARELHKNLNEVNYADEGTQLMKFASKGN